MSDLRDGQQVSYIGTPTSDGLLISDRGQTLSVTDRHSHVLWSTGTREGQIDLIDNDDLVGHGPGKIAGSIFDDSMTTGAGMVTLSVRETFDVEGPSGLLNAMNDAGHLASLEGIAEDALAHVCAQVRTDPAFRSVLSHLDENEAAEFISLTSNTLLRDAFGEA